MSGGAMPSLRVLRRQGARTCPWKLALRSAIIGARRSTLRRFFDDGNRQNGVSMETAQIYEKLTEVFHDVFDDDSLVLTPELSADDVDEWDSLSHLRLILTVQKAFNVKLSAAEIGKLKNVGELAELIKAKT
jgi:acyl carrier protein